MLLYRETGDRAVSLCSAFSSSRPDQQMETRLLLLMCGPIFRRIPQLILDIHGHRLSIG